MNGMGSFTTCDFLSMVEVDVIVVLCCFEDEPYGLLDQKMAKLIKQMNQVTQTRQNYFRKNCLIVSFFYHAPKSLRSNMLRFGKSRIFTVDDGILLTILPYPKMPW